MRSASSHNVVLRTAVTHTLETREALRRPPRIQRLLPGIFLYYEYPVTVMAGAEKLSAAVETSVSGGTVPVSSTPISGVTSVRKGSLQSKIRVFAIAMAIVTYFQGSMP